MLFFEFIVTWAAIGNKFKQQWNKVAKKPWFTHTRWSFSSSLDFVEVDEEDFVNVDEDAAVDEDVEDLLEATNCGTIMQY